MVSRVLPNVGLEGGRAAHENGWADEMNLNLLKSSVLTQAVAKSKVSATPGSPVAKDVYLFDEDHPTQANKIAVWEGPVGDEEWSYITPHEGWLVYNATANYYEKFDGTVWAEFETGGGGGGGIEEAPEDGSLYARKDAAWEAFVPGAGGGGGIGGGTLLAYAYGNEEVAAGPLAGDIAIPDLEVNFHLAQAGDVWIKSDILMVRASNNGRTRIILEIDGEVFHDGDGDRFYSHAQGENNYHSASPGWVVPLDEGTHTIILRANDALIVADTAFWDRYLVVYAMETGSSGGSAGRALPTMVQFKAIRGDTTVTLDDAPTEGNMMVWLCGGWGPGLPGYIPAGFLTVGSFYSDSNNAILCAIRRVESGDTGSYAVSSGDNQAGILYEFSGCAAVAPGNGGGLPNASGDFAAYVAPNPYHVNGLSLIGIESDQNGQYIVFDVADGIDVDYEVGSDGNNHAPSFARVQASAEGFVTGTSGSGTYTNPVFGVFHVVGVAVAASGGSPMVAITQDDYDLLSPPDPDTYYFIIEP